VSEVIEGEVKVGEVAGFATDGDDDGESCNEDEDNKG